MPNHKPLSHDQIEEALSGVHFTPDENFRRALKEQVAAGRVRAVAVSERDIPRITAPIFDVQRWSFSTVLSALLLAAMLGLLVVSIIRSNGNDITPGSQPGVEGDAGESTETPESPPVVTATPVPTLVPEGSVTGTLGPTALPPTALPPLTSTPGQAPTAVPTSTPVGMEPDAAVTPTSTPFAPTTTPDPLSKDLLTPTRYPHDPPYPRQHAIPTTP